MHNVELVKQVSIPLNQETCISALHSCIERKALPETKKIHASFVKNTLSLGILLWNALINTYIKCGGMETAEVIFDRLSIRDTCTWSTIISGYTQHDRANDAFKMFFQMQDQQVKCNRVTFASIVNACAIMSAMEEGKLVHANILRAKCENDIYVGNTLLNMYTKCSRIVDAYGVFIRMRTQDVCTWTTIIAGFVQHGDSKVAFYLFNQMLLKGVSPDKFTFVGVINACAINSVLQSGKLFHAKILGVGFELDIFLGSSLIDMYAKCGSMEDSRQVFKRLPAQNVVSWSAMIGGLVQEGDGPEALEYYNKMQQQGFKPNKVTLMSIVGACSGQGQGKRVHADILQAICESDVYVGSTLVDMYAGCGNISNACQVFNRLSLHTIVSFNIMLAGYVHNGDYLGALQLFKQMSIDDIEPDKFSFVSILSSCTSAMVMEYGKWVHASILLVGEHLDIFINSSLISMYAKCGVIESARCVFDILSVQDVVSWNAMFTGYIENADVKQALDLFVLMAQEGVKPDEATFVSLMSACSGVAALQEGKKIHKSILENNPQLNSIIGNALIDMYAKCGSIEDARQVFYSLPVRDIVSWNAIIAGYAQHGDGMEALKMFEIMLLDVVMPDDITFISALSACNHACLLDKGCYYFSSVTGDYGITLKVQHYACITDLLGRIGQLHQALDFINSLPFETAVESWTSLLAACKVYGNKELGEQALGHVLSVEPSNDSAYVLLSNIYAMVVK